MTSIDAWAELTGMFYQMRQMKDKLPQHKQAGNIGNIYKEMQMEPGLFFHQSLEYFDRDFDKLMTRVRVYVEKNYKKMSEQLRLFEDILGSRQGRQDARGTDHELFEDTLGTRQGRQDDRGTDHGFNEKFSSTLKGMAALVLLQSLNMYMAWKRVSVAINYKKDEYEHEINRINQEVEKIQRLVNEFGDLQTQRSQSIRLVFRKLQRINKLCRSTLRKISSLKVKMNGEEQCLGLQRDQSYRDGMASLGNAANQAQRLCENWSDLHPVMKVFQGVCVVFHAWSAYKDYQKYQLSQDALKDLRNKLHEVTILQDKVEDLLDEAEEKYEEMEDRMPYFLLIWS